MKTSVWLGGHCVSTETGAPLRKTTRLCCSVPEAQTHVGLGHPSSVRALAHSIRRPTLREGARSCPGDGAIFTWMVTMPLVTNTHLLALWRAAGRCQRNLERSAHSSDCNIPGLQDFRRRIDFKVTRCDRQCLDHLCSLDSSHATTCRA